MDWISVLFGVVLFVSFLGGAMLVALVLGLDDALDDDE